MVRSGLANDHLSNYLTNFANQNSTVVGLILGQTCLGKDYIVHFAKTSFLKTDEETGQTSIEKFLGTVTDIDESAVAEHAKQVTRMLPGGIYLLGIFIVSPEDILNPFSAKVKSVLLSIHKHLNTNKYLYGNYSDEKLVLNYCIKSKRHCCKSYNVVNFNTQPVDFQFLPNSSKFVQVDCKLEIDHLRYLQKTEADWHLQKHFQVILNKLQESLDTALYFFDDDFRDGDECIDNSDKKKARGKRSQKNEMKEELLSKPMKVSIFQTKHSSASDTYSVLETCGQLRIVGQVACRLWLHPKLTINEASVAVKQDIMRSLASRLEMHWDSLTEEENLEDINCVHEPPRRVLIELPNNSITLSDYLFPGEGPQDAKASLEELLDIKIKGKLKIQDVEGQADISQFLDSALGNENTEILQKLSKESNNFLYITAILGVFVLLVSIILHFYKN